MKHFSLALLLPALLLALPAQAQDVEMADAMRANGKIYVVVAVVLTVLAGLFIYLLAVDRKLTRLEKDNETRVNR